MNETVKLEDGIDNFKKSRRPRNLKKNKENRSNF